MFSADNVELSLNQGSKPKAHSKNLSTRSDIAIDKFEDAFENEIIDEGDDEDVTPQEMKRHKAKRVKRNRMLRRLHFG